MGGATILMCDSSIPRRDDGYLADETIDWMDRTLGEEPEAPAFICFHHPPVILHTPLVDGIRQNGEDRLAKLIRRHSRVVAVLCGHAHTSAVSMFAGRPLLVAPGVVSTLLLPWEPKPDGPVALHEPPAVAFHILDDELRMTTHYRVIV